MLSFGAAWEVVSPAGCPYPVCINSKGTSERAAPTEGGFKARELTPEHWAVLSLQLSKAGVVSEGHKAINHPDWEPEH